MASSKQQPVVPVEHFNEREHRRLLAVRSNAALTPVLSGLTAGQLLRWDGEAWVNDGESGTWTPTYSTTGTDFDAVTYAVQSGRYVRTGDLVFVEARLRTSSVTKGSASGNVIISGLPFVVASVDTVSAPSLGWANAFLADHPISALFVNTRSDVFLYKRASSTSATTNLVVADVATGASANDVIFSGWYTTA